MTSNPQPNYDHPLDAARPILPDRDYTVDGVNDAHLAMQLRLDQGYYREAEVDSTSEVLTNVDVVEIGSVAVMAERRKTRQRMVKLVAAMIMLR